MPKSLLLTAGVLALALSARAGEDGVDLSLRLEAGRAYRYETVMDQNMDIDISGPGAKMSMKNSTTTTSAIQMLGKDEKGNYRLEMSTERIKSAVKSPMMNFEYDSANPADKEKEKNLMGRFFALMVATKFTAVVEPSGKVLTSSGRDAIEKKLAEEFPEAVDQSKMMTQGLSDEVLWGSLFLNAPGAIKKPGDSWATERTAMGMMRMKITTKLDRIEDGHIFLAPAGLEIAFGDFTKPGEAANPMAAVAKNFKVTKSEMTGSTRMSQDTRMVEDSNNKLVMDYGMNVPEQNVDMAFHLEQTTSAKLLPVDAKKAE